MKFIVKPKSKSAYKGGGRTTLCAKCSENPAFCDGPI